MKFLTKHRATEVSLTLLRFVAAIIMIQNGGLKLFDWFGGLPNGADAHVFSLLWIAGVLEFFGGFAILAGFKTRLVAFILSGEMAFAYFIGHAAYGHFFVPLINQGQPAVLLSFIFLYFAAHGAGEWSVDRHLAERHE